MEMSKFILHGDILSLQANIDGLDYRIAVRWKNPKKPYDETWDLESYGDMKTGEKNLTDKQIKEFLDTINARWNWDVDSNSGL